MSSRRLASLFLLLLSLPAWSQGRGTNPNAGSRNPNTVGNIATITTADDEGKVEFHSQTILMQVPTIVTDKVGNHIHNLTKDDFHIFENGKEQKVSTFEEVVTTNAKIPAMTPKAGEFTNLALSDAQPRAITVIALDTVNTPFLDQATGRRELVKYLANTLDSGRVLALMIITSKGLRIVQGLTGDPEQLVQVLKKVSGDFPASQGIDIDAQADAASGDIPAFPMLALGADPAAAMEQFIQHGDAIIAQFQQQNAIETTMNAFLAIAWSLSGVPGRKSLIWATGGFPFSIPTPAAVPGGYLSVLYERAMAALTQANISVYPVDVRGLVNTSLTDARSSRVRSGAEVARRSWLQQSSIDTLNDFAEMTGGKAFYNTNDLATSFKRAAEDASSYYLLGYYLDLHNDHAGWRSLKVKVEKKDTKDTQIRTRKGFFVTNATVHMEMTRTSDLSNALTSPIEGTGVPVGVQWNGVTGDGDKKKAIFITHIPPNALSFDPKGQNQLNFDFAAMAFNEKDGKKAGEVGFEFAKPVPEAQLATIRTDGVLFRNALELSPGKYVVRFVVRDNVTGKIGSVTAPLTVN